MKLPYMKFWFGDYLANTMHLSTIEHGAYVLLLFAYYGNSGPLHDDDAQLANITRLSAEEWERIRPKLAQFFTIENGLWKQRRADSEIAEYRSNVDAKTASGKKAASARWNRGNDATAMRTQCDRNADAMRTQCERNASHSHSQKKVKDTTEDTTVQPLAGAPLAQTAISDHLASLCNTYQINLDSMALLIREGFTTTEIEYAILQCKSSNKTPSHWPSYLRSLCRKNREAPPHVTGTPFTATAPGQQDAPVRKVPMSEADRRKLAEIRGEAIV